MRRLIKEIGICCAWILTFMACGVVLVFCGCGDPTWLDNGRSRRPVELPWSVVYDETVMEEIGADHVNEAADWWQVQASRDGTSRSWIEMGGHVSAGPLDHEILVVVEVLPDDGDEALEAEVAELEWNAAGEIIKGTIAINQLIAYDAETVQIGLRHGLGHFMGLDDDPGPPVTVDLRSIMAKPLDPLGRLTDHDWQLIVDDVLTPPDGGDR